MAFDLEKNIQERIHAVIADAILHIHSDDGAHYQIRVASALFKNLKRLEQHRLVMNALADLIESNQLHAVQLTTEAL